MTRRWKDEDYISIVTRRDLPWSARVAQVAHAAMKFADTFDSCIGTEIGSDPRPVLVYGVDGGEESLDSLRAELNDSGREFVVWREPDMRYESTALAVNGPLDHLRLL